MQGTMDIMALMKQSNVTKQKTNAKESSKSFDMQSFKKELAEARSSRQAEAGRMTGDSNKKEASVLDNKAERLARLMSGNKVNTDKLENAAKEEVKQTQPATDTKEKDVKVVTKVGSILEEAVKLEEETTTELSLLVKSAEELIGQLMQHISGTDTTETAKVSIENITEALEATVQKLEQLMSKTADSKTIDVNTALKDLKVEIKDLIKQLKADAKTNQSQAVEKPTLMQTVETLKHLINKMNKIKPELHEGLSNAEITPELAEQTVKAAVKEVKDLSKDLTSQNEAKQSEQGIELKPKAEVDAKASDGKDSSKDEQKTSDNKTAKEMPEQTAAADKPKTIVQPDFVIPQNDNGAFQAELKEVNLNLKKEGLVTISKSEIVNQVVKKADIILREGHSEMIMKLEPESLGKLNLKIVVEKGLVTAKFIAESLQVKEVLESSFNQLKDALQEKGISVQNFSVSVGQQGGDASSNQSFSQWKQSIKVKNKSIGEFMDLEDQMMITQNPYSFHEGKVDFRA